MDDVIRGGLLWFWDMSGRPMSLRAWADLFGSPERFLARDDTPRGQVVTAWLGTTDDGLPLPPGQRPDGIYGTCLLGSDMELRAATREEALANHARMLASIEESA